MGPLAVVVLTLVFLDELAAWTAWGVWGAHVGPAWLLSWLLPLAVVVLWALVASPRAPWAHPVATPVVKVLVLGGGVVLLAAAGHVAWAVALGVLTAASHLATLLPGVRAAHAGGADPSLS